MLRRYLLAALLLSTVAAAAFAAPRPRGGRDPAALPPISLPSPTIYPLGVIAVDNNLGTNEMHQVWDLHGMQGSRIAKASLTNWSTYGTSPGWPSGISTAVGSEEPHVVNDVSGASNILNSIDFTNSSLTIRNAGTGLTVTDFYSGNSGGVHSLNLGITEGGVTTGTPGIVALNYGTFDFTGLSNNSATPIEVASVTNLSFTQVKFDNAPGDLFVAAGNVSLNWVYFGGFEQNPKTTNVYPTACTVANRAHAEPLKPNGGTWTLKDVLFDLSDLPIPNTCIAGFTSTGPFFDAAALPNQPISATLDHVAMRGAQPAISAGQPVLYTMQSKCLPPNTSTVVTGSISGNVLTVTSFPSGGAALAVGNVLKASGAHIIGLISGTGGTGTYQLTTTPDAASGSITVTAIYDPNDSIATVTNSAIDIGSVGYSLAGSTGLLILTGVTGTFGANDFVTDGVPGHATGRIMTDVNNNPLWDPVSGILQIYPSDGTAAQWNGTPAMSGTLTDTTNGTASATIGHAKLATCKVVNGGGNYDLDTGVLIDPTAKPLF